jgi:hypothetical protein
MRNAYGTEIIGNSRCIIECEIRVQLKPVCRGGNARHFLVAPGWFGVGKAENSALGYLMRAEL